MARCIRLSVLGLLVIGMTASVFAADWPQWRGPDYDGISKETAWNPGALSESTKPVWTAEIGVGFSSVSVVGGKAVAMGNVNKDTDRVVCFDAKTGEVLWEHTYDEPLNPKYYEGGPGSTPTIADGKVYTLSKTARAFCLNLEDGKVVWERKFDYKEPEWGFAGSALIWNDLAIFNVGESGAAVNKDTGEPVWQSDNDQAGYATGVPVKMEGAETVVMFCKDSVVGLEPKTGKVLWSAPWDTKYGVNAADPIVQGNEVFIASGYNRGCSLLRVSDGETQTVWENKHMRSQMSGPVLIDGYLYGFDDNELACVDWKTGEKKWSERSTGKGSLSAQGDTLIVISEKGKLIAAKATPEKYEAISSAQVLSGRCWTMPILADGRIYTRNAKGEMVCVDVSQGK